jgi:hypothetical protein
LSNTTASVVLNGKGERIPEATRERVLVAMTGAPHADRLIRRAARIATRARSALVGLHDGAGMHDRVGEQSAVVWKFEYRTPISAIRRMVSAAGPSRSSRPLAVSRARVRCAARPVRTLTRSTLRPATTRRRCWHQVWARGRNPQGVVRFDL